MNDERFVYVSVGKGMLDLVSSFTNEKSNDKNQKKILSNLDKIKILTLENNSDEKLMNTVLRDLNEIIHAGKYDNYN